MIFFHDLPMILILFGFSTIFKQQKTAPSPLPRRCSEALGWHLRPSCRGRRGLCYPAPGAPWGKTVEKDRKYGKSMGNLYFYTVIAIKITYTLWEY